jgi:transferase family hexapeptide repeat protein
MRAILDVECDRGGEICKTTLVDRPFLHHTIEHLVMAGATEIHLSLGTEAPSPLEPEMVDHWGSPIRSHRSTWSEVLGSLVAEGSDEPFLVGRSYCLPNLLSLPRLREEIQHSLALIHWRPAEGVRKRWTGWFGLPAQGVNVGAGVAGIAVSGGGKKRTASDCLFLEPAASLFEAHQRILRGTFPSAFLRGMEVCPGVRMGWRANVSPDAKLSGPVFVGELAKIGKGSEIGPNVVVGARSVIGRDCRISDSVILPDTYVADGMQLTNTLAAGEVVTDLDTGVQLNLGSEFLMRRLGRVEAEAA